MMAGLTPSSSNASSMTMCASPRAEPPPSARAMRGLDAERVEPVDCRSQCAPAASRLSLEKCFLRGGWHGGRGAPPVWRLGGLARQYALELALELLLGRPAAVITCLKRWNSSTWNSSTSTSM